MSADEEGRRPELALSDCLLVREEGVRSESFELCHLRLAVERGDTYKYIAFIAIARIQGALLVALPSDCWHRTVARRVLPRGALSKPVLLEVSFLGDETESLRKVQVWVGFLSPAAMQILPTRTL